MHCIKTVASIRQLTKDQAHALALPPAPPALPEKTDAKMDETKDKY